MTRFRNRYRIARTRAAWHLLRHGAVIYGCRFASAIPIPIKTARPVLVSNNHAQHEEQGMPEWQRQAAQEYLCEHYDAEGRRLR